MYFEQQIIILELFLNDYDSPILLFIITIIKFIISPIMMLKIQLWLQE